MCTLTKLLQVVFKSQFSCRVVFVVLSDRQSMRKGSVSEKPVWKSSVSQSKQIVIPKNQDPSKENIIQLSVPSTLSIMDNQPVTISPAANETAVVSSESALSGAAANEVSTQIAINLPVSIPPKVAPKPVKKKNDVDTTSEVHKLDRQIDEMKVINTFDESYRI